MECTLPSSLADESDVFVAAPRPAQGPLSAGMFGTGFALRLVRAEARAIGGAFEHVDDTLRLDLPLLTAARRDPSSPEPRDERRQPQARLP